MHSTKRSEYVVATHNPVEPAECDIPTNVRDRKSTPWVAVASRKDHVALAYSDADPGKKQDTVSARQPQGVGRKRLRTHNFRRM